MASRAAPGQSEVEKTNLQILGRPQAIMADLTPERQDCWDGRTVGGDQIADGHKPPSVIEASQY
jgi:hypothetical protein